MKGQKLSDAIAAATTFVQGTQSNDTLGVYAFGSKPYISVALPSDSATAAAGLANLATDPTPGTAIYGGVKEAADALAATHADRKAIVLLTDGSSENDSATIDQAVASAKAAHAAIYAVGIELRQRQAALQTLAHDTNGEFLQATNRAALIAAYGRISADIGGTFTFTYRQPRPQGDADPPEPRRPRPQSGRRRHGSGPGRCSRQRVQAADPHAHVDRRSSRRRPRRRVLVLLGALMLLSSRPGVAVNKRIAAYTEPKKQPLAIPGVSTAKVSISAVPAVHRDREDRRLLQLLEEDGLSARAGGPPAAHGRGRLHPDGRRAAHGRDRAVPARPERLPRADPARAGRRRAVALRPVHGPQAPDTFESQLPETLITLAASLKAGHAFNSALASVVKEGAEPTSKELARVAQEIQLGMTSEAALEAMAKRMDSTNFGFVVMAVNIQRTVGGSLAEILDMVADTVRQRQQFSRKVKALTAQGRMSAYVLLAMPFLMGLAIFALNPAYMSILFTSTAGKALIAVSLVMMAIGGVIIRKIVSFKG